MKGSALIASGRYFLSFEWSVSPYINQFLSADTIVPSYNNPQNLNRYSYVTNNPLRYTDPTGHMRIQNGPQRDRFSQSVDDRYRPQPTRTGRHNNNRGDGAETISSLYPGNNPYVGTPQDLGDYLSGVWAGGGSPNSFGVNGFTPEQEGDQVYLAGVGAGLNYHATYGAEFYENGAKLYLSERYSLSENTFHTQIESAGSILNIKTADGIAHQVSLGEFNIGKDQQKSTTVNVYGSYPSEMHINIMINLSQSVVLSAPLPSFEFAINPFDVWP